MAKHWSTQHYVSLEYGIRTFDSSIGGLGGCPYNPGATGNVAIEDMVCFMEELGMKPETIWMLKWILVRGLRLRQILATSSVRKATLGKRARSLI
jgi:hydroxymethylglutaryl-CoA lyase